jgi:hypothetical protein
MWGFFNVLPGLATNHDPPNVASCIVEITGMSQHAWPQNSLSIYLNVCNLNIPVIQSKIHL